MSETENMLLEIAVLYSDQIGATSANSTVNQVEETRNHVVLVDSINQILGLRPKKDIHDEQTQRNS